MPSKKPFLRETNVWRLLGLFTAALGLFAPDAVAIDWMGVRYPTLFFVVGLATFAWPMILEGYREWKK
jgi:hypothetical protein